MGFTQLGHLSRDRITGQDPKAFKAASVVFVGTVESVTNGDRFAKVRVEDVLKGPALPTTVEVRGGPEDPNINTANDRRFKAGGRYGYLRDRIRDPDTVSFFCDEANAVESLGWLTDEPLFRDLFSTTAPPTEVGQRLSWWFAERFTGDHSVEAMASVARHGGTLCPTLWGAVAQALWTRRPDPEILLAWLPVLLAAAPERTSELLDYLLQDSRPERDDRAAVLLFEFLTEPVPVLDLDSGPLASDLPERARLELKARGFDYWLEEAWARVFVPRLAAFARQLLAIATRHLERAHALLVACDGANADWDAMSNWRAAIEPHARDGQRGAEWSDVLVDAARESIDWATGHDVDLARAYLVQWAGSDGPLLRRLAVYTLQRATWLDADAKLGWLVERGWLLSSSLHHEIYSLLAASYSEASFRARRLVLELLDAGPGEDLSGGDPDLAVHIVFELLGWLAQHSTDDEDVRARIAALTASHPDLPVGAHPDLRSRTDVRFGHEAPSPIAAEALVERSPEDEELLALLLTHGRSGDRDAAAGRPLDGERASLLGAVRAASVSDPTWSLGLARALVARGKWHTDLGDALIEAWATAPLDEGAWNHVLGLLEADTDKRRYARAVANLLEEAVRSSPPKLTAGQTMQQASPARCGHP